MQPANEGSADSTGRPESGATVLMAHCPECDVNLRFHTPLNRGQLVACYECGETLEVVSARPLRLTWAYDEPPGDD